MLVACEDFILRMVATIVEGHSTTVSLQADHRTCEVTLLEIRHCEHFEPLVEHSTQMV
jgi:hypothetical protein